MKILLLLLSLVLMASASPVYSELSGGSYKIYADTFSFVSTGYSIGGTYALFDSGGEFFAATSTGGDYALRGGFRSAEKGILRITLSDTDVSLGELSTSSIAVASTTITIETDNFNGYTLAIRETGEFLSGSDDIDDVTDDKVSAGSEEYGFGLSGVDSVSITDNAITGIYSTIASSVSSTIGGNITEVGFKASVSSSTASGAYSHTVQFLATVNP